MGIAIGLAMLATSACGSSPPSESSTPFVRRTPEVNFQGSNAREDIQSFEWDNCSGRADLKRIESRSWSVNVTISAEIAAKLSASVEVISAEIQTSVGLALSSERTRTSSIEVVAPPRTRMYFEIGWIGDERVGVVHNYRDTDIPIVFRSFTPVNVRMKEQKDLGCPGQQGAQTPVVSSQTAAVSPSQANTSFSGRGLRLDEVRSWCTGAACTISRFVELIESNGFNNPNGVGFSRGGCASFTIPGGISVDFWDGTKATWGIKGPIQLAVVCEASFRRL